MLIVLLEVRKVWSLLVAKYLALDDPEKLEGCLFGEGYKLWGIGVCILSELLAMELERDLDAEGGMCCETDVDPPAESKPGGLG